MSRLLKRAAEIFAEGGYARRAGQVRFSETEAAIARAFEEELEKLRDEVSNIKWEGKE